MCIRDRYFNCSNYKGNRGTCGSTHYVRVDFLEQVVLGEIRRLTKYAGLYEDDFLKEVIGHSRQAEETERRLKEKELKDVYKRQSFTLVESAQTHIEKNCDEKDQLNIQTDF